MGSQIREMNNTIDLETLKNMLKFTPLYLEDTDTLIFQPEKPVPAISVDLDGDLMLRIDPNTRQIVGVEIEDFQEYFIVKYPDFAPIWKQMKRTIKKNKLENELLTTFLTIVQELLSELVNKQGNIVFSPSELKIQPSLL